MKNIRKLAIVFVTLLTAFFLISPSSFAASDDDFVERFFYSLVPDRVERFLYSLFPDGVRQGAADIVVIYDSEGQGTGFVVRDEKRNRFLLLTAWHVMEESLKKPEYIRIKHKTGELKIKEILAYSEEHDVFIGVLENYKGSGLVLADSSDYNSDNMYILGFPDGRFRIERGKGFDYKSTPSFGIVRDFEKSFEGSSGGPILNEKAEMIGILLSTDLIEIAYALKGEYFKDLLFDVNTPQAKWQEAGFVVIEKPFEEAIKYIKTPEHRKGGFRMIGVSFEGNLSRLKEIAEDGSSTAQMKLSWLLEGSGILHGIPGQMEEAIYYLKLAAQQGRVEAMISLGEKLYEGDGIPQDRSEAANWFQLIIKNHHLDIRADVARFFLAKMMEKGDGMPQNKPKAAQIYEQLIESENAFYEIEAKKRLAKMLERGDGIPQDKKRARWFLQEAEKQEFEAAQRMKAPENESPKAASGSQNMKCSKSFSSGRK